ncbi:MULTISPECIES: helix-turn-helix domain-containing protein [Mycobacterium]|nr:MULTISPECIES: helix-turn-helix transcriptional regulator [Mycobacterium]
MQVRAELIDAINHRIAANGWTQAEAAQRLNVTQPRISYLARRQIDRFSVDALLNMAALAGLQIEIAVHTKQRELGRTARRPDRQRHTESTRTV